MPESSRGFKLKVRSMITKGKPVVRGFITAKPFSSESNKASVKYTPEKVQS
jgi:hypothetical protein